MQLLHTGKAAVCRTGAVTGHLIKAAFRKRPLLWPLWQTLPVAGIDVAAAQGVLYYLRRCLSEEEEVTAAVQSWLHALQLSQVASDRLLHAVSITQKHLRFWQTRLKAGSHGSFLLLSLGPLGFTADVLERLRLQNREQVGILASDRIEERIIALQLLTTQLAEALSAVHRAAAGLKLSEQMHSPQHASQHIKQQVLAVVTACCQAQVTALEALQSTSAQQWEHTSTIRQLSATSSFHLHQQLPWRQQQPTRQPGAKAATLEGTRQQLQTLATLLHVQDDELTTALSGDAKAVLDAAARLAAQLGPLVHVPRWAAMPSSLQRHWIKYTVAAGISVYAGMFLYRNSRLAGSHNLEKWVAAGVSAVEDAWTNHVVDPLWTVRNELFATFRDRPSIVSTAEFEADKASLLRMLADFQKDYPQPPADQGLLPSPTNSSIGSSSAGSSGSTSAIQPDVQPDIMNIDAVNKGMQVVMQCYESDLKNPVRGLIIGELARTLLIQVQRLKLDTEAAMLELDQILRANELSISLVAAVPALLLSWTLLRALWVFLLVRAPPDARREATPCRLAMAELERALAALAAAEQTHLQEPRLQGAAPNGVARAEGVVLYKLFKVYREAQALYRLKDSNSRYSDWPHMSADLLSMVPLGELAAETAAKLELHRQMLRTYTVLQP